jgi:3-hydroxypropanoate dehydrogenase
MHHQSEPPSLVAIKTPISQEALDQLFREARTHSAWLPEPVPVELLRKAYELARLGPTSANGAPARFVFLTSPGAKARLKPVLAPGNVDKTMSAPVTVVIYHRLGHGVPRESSQTLSAG